MAPLLHDTKTLSTEKLHRWSRIISLLAESQSKTFTLHTVAIPPITVHSKIRVYSGYVLLVLDRNSLSYPEEYITMYTQGKS